MSDPYAGRLITADELAERWGISKSGVYALLTTRGLPSIKIGKSRRFDPVACDEWLAALQTAA
jgi:excisionase family DNA binding protein